MLRKFLYACAFLLLASFVPGIKSVEAATYYWARWNTYNFDGTTYTLTGTITTATDTVTVTYTNTQGLAGYQLNDGSGGNTNYYSGGTDGAAGTSPYTSATVENRPDNVTIIRLSNAGTQTVTFNKNISNLAFAFVSLNGTAFSFDRNFNILSFGDATDGNACGYWGCGTATKTSGGGSYPYVVSGTGEPHGTLLFSGSFNSLTWTSGNENWHGFTVGIAGTSAEVASDATAPTVTIDPANGSTNISVSTNITITFNEEVRNTDDTPLTNTNVDGLITLKDTNASGANIPFDATIDSANKVITINPTSDFSADQVIYVAIGATVEDTYNNAISATNATMTTGSSLPSQATPYTDPRAKKDVVGNIMAWSGMAEHWARVNLDSTHYRFDWLRRNKDASERSDFALNVGSQDPVVSKLIGAASGRQKTSAASDAVSTLQNQFSVEDQPRNNIGPALADAALSQAVQKAQDSILGDTDKSLVDNALSQSRPWWRKLLGQWSLWTHGDIAIGKTRGTDSTSQQDINGNSIFIGMDRLVHKNGLFGFVAGLGKSDTDVGSAGSGVKSDNYSVSGYTAFELPGSWILETALGYGRMQMDITRIDGSQTLIGARDANQIFGSIELQSQQILYGDFSFSPYGRFEAAHTSLDAFSETGGDMALAFARQNITTTMAFVGADAGYDLKIGKGQFRPFAKLEYGVNVSYDSDVNLRYVLDTTDYRYTLESGSSSLWRAGIGFDFQIKAGTSISVAYFRTQTFDSDYLDNIEFKISIDF